MNIEETTQQALNAAKASLGDGELLGNMGKSADVMKMAEASLKVQCAILLQLRNLNLRLAGVQTETE